MNDNVKHELALCCAKLFVENNIQEYQNTKYNSYDIIVSDLLSCYLDALKQIDKELPLKG